MVDSPQFEFSVRYRLAEYLSFVTEHSFATEESLRDLTGLKRRFVQACMKTIATMMFLYKSARVGECHFRIDSTGICRLSKSGKGMVPWPKIKAIHAYSPGYLIEMQRGAMPIPFRVLSTEQTQAFCQLAGELMYHETPPNNSFKPKPLRGSA